MSRPPIRLKLEGAKELDAKLAELGTNIAGKAGTRATRAAARALREALIEEAPYNPAGPTLKVYTDKNGGVSRTDYGHLRDNLRVRRVRAKKPYMIRFQVTTGQAFWGAFLEWGTVRMAAKPWARPLFERMHVKLIDVVMTTLRKAVETAARRKARAARRAARIGHNGGPPMSEGD